MEESPFAFIRGEVTQCLQITSNSRGSVPVYTQRELKLGKILMTANTW
jgi:hypothetical protein